MSDLRPLLGRPPCAFKPGLDCTDDCEYPLVGTCGHEKLEPDVPGPIVIDHIAPSHGSPGLDADAAKLEALGADPGPSLECLGPAIPELEWLKLTPRQTELMLWQLLSDMGGEISTIPPDDLPTRSVMFYRDDGEYVGMICNEAGDDE